MYKKILSLLLVITVVIAGILPLGVLSSENVIFSDDFESYLGNVAGGWRVQPSGTVATENTLNGKSAKIVSTSSSRCEFIKEFTKTSDDAQCVVFSFSMCLGDNGASRTLLSKTEETGELFLMTFKSSKNTISINGTDVPESEFSYKTDVWYDVRFSYNLGDGVIKVEFLDYFGEKTVLYGSGNTGITGIERINFASFTSSLEQSVWYVDNVSVYVTEAFTRPLGFSVINENFDRCDVESDIYGFECDKMTNVCEKPFGTVESDRGKSASVTVNGTSEISRSAAYLKGEEYISFIAAVKSTGGADVSFGIDGAVIAQADFKNGQIAAGSCTKMADIKQNEWTEFEGQINTKQGVLNLNVTHGGKTDNILCDYNFGYFEPLKFKITISSGEECTVLIDNLALEGFIIEKDVKAEVEAPVISYKTQTELYKADFTSYTGGVPKGWGFQSYYNEASLLEGDGCIKISGGGHGCRFSKSFKDEEMQGAKCLKFECVLEFGDTSCERYIAFTDNDGNDLYFLEFLKDSGKIKLLGKIISESVFTYNADTRYSITGEYNLKTGYGRITVSCDGLSRTIDASGDTTEQVRCTVLGVSGSKSDSSTLVYSMSFYSKAQITAKEEKISRIGADDFEYYNNGVPARFTGTFTGGGRVCAKDSAYGICAALMSKLGGSCTLAKNIDGLLGNVFYTGISVCSPDGCSEGALYVRVSDADGSNTKDVRLLSFSTDGIKIGNTALGFEFNKGTWYNADVLCNTYNGEVTATVNGSSVSTTVSDLCGKVTSYYIKSTGTTSSESAFCIDNVVFCKGGFYGIDKAPSLRNLSAGTQKLTLNFTEPVSECKVLVNGTDSLVREVSSNGNNVIVNLEPLERGKSYSLSFSNATDSHGNIFSGNFRFTTSGSDVKVINSGIKSENGTNYISNGTLTAYARLQSDAERDVNVYICVYDRDKHRLLGIKTKKVRVSPDDTDIEGYIKLPENYYDYTIGYYIWDSGTIAPVKGNSELLPYNIPDGETVIRQIEEKTEGEHPRLLANKNDFNKIRAEISSNSAAAGDYYNLLDSADDIMRKPLTSYTISGVTLMTSSPLLTRIKTLAMAYRITGNSTYAERVYLELENAAQNFGDWNSQHFLDTSNIIMAFAIGYDWIYDYISDNAQRKAVIVNAMKNIGFKAVLDDYLDRDRYRTNRWLYIVTPDNWNIYCNAAALTAAIAFSDDLPQECTQIFDYGFKYIQTAMQQFAPDGGWFEGVGYWDYLMNPLVMLLGSMEKSIGSYYGLTDAEGFRNTAYYLIGMTGSSDIVFNFHNCLDEHIYAGELFYLAKLYGDKNIYAFINGFLRRNRTPVPFQSLLWNDYEDDGEYDNMPLDYMFRDTEVCSMRSGWGQNDTFVALHAGNNALVHGHSDVGEFVLDMQGERFAMALGKDNYELVTPIWHGLYRERAEGHNTIVLNPCANPDQSRTSNALIDRFESRADEALAVTDMTTAYKDNASFAIRGVKLTDNRRVVVVRDEIECIGNSDIWWFMHTDANISLSGDGKTAVLTKNNKRIKMSVLGNNGQKFEVMDASPFPTTLLPTNGTQNPNTGIKKLAIHISSAKNANITVAASPENYILKEEYQTNINEW